eukprot:scaffold1486_cov329-Prasinococcus_capsulatus_cf.AAC.8
MRRAACDCPPHAARGGLRGALGTSESQALRASRRASYLLASRPTCSLSATRQAGCQKLRGGRERCCCGAGWPEPPALCRTVSGPRPPRNAARACAALAPAPSAALAVQGR